MGLVDRTPSMQRAKLLRGLRIGELNPTQRFSPIQAIRGLQIPGVQLQPRSVKSPPCCSRPPNLDGLVIAKSLLGSKQKTGAAWVRAEISAATKTRRAQRLSRWIADRGCH